MDKKAANTNGTTKWKIQPDRIESDDCVVYVGRVLEDGEVREEGTPYYVHTGEWVELLPTRSLAELITLSNLTTDSAGSLETLCQELSQRIISWNWTGMDNEALPQPYGNPATIASLTDDEVLWLIDAAKGRETSAARKND